jgi:(S)-ureidoglycine-glyoxylate aminotransferase
MSDRLVLPELDPPARLLMGPGPVNAHPRVLRAMSAALLGQFDPAFTAYMTAAMAAYRGVFETQNHWTLLIDGTARAAIEAAMISVLEPGDMVVIASAGRFGGLLQEIAERAEATPVIVAAPWGEVVSPVEIARAIEVHRPRLFASVHGDTSTTMAQPFDGVGEACRATGALFYVDATATLAGMATPADRWGADIVTGGLQKCLGGPSGIAPITISDRAAERILGRRHVEAGLRAANAPVGEGRRIASNYFDLAMILDYWSEKRLNHHTESTSLLYAAYECARVVLEEGLPARFARHAVAGAAVSAGVEAMGLSVYGDRSHKMTNVTGVVIPEGVDGDEVRTRLLQDFSIEIGSSFGPLHGRIWRIGAMGYNATRPAVLTTLAAFEAVLAGVGAPIRKGQAVDAARAVFEAEG